MTSYTDLTNEQLLTLHHLAQGEQYTPAKPTIVRGEHYITIRTGPYETRFDVITGDIDCHLLSHNQGVCAIWQIVQQCQQWGLRY